MKRIREVDVCCSLDRVSKGRERSALAKAYHRARPDQEESVKFASLIVISSRTDF
jgi:hypothetical protein